MDEQDRKLDRAETERIELMEVCPVCGEQRRNTARFCTTCGHRFATDEIEHTAPAPSPVSPVTNAPDVGDPVISGWPAPLPPSATSPWAPAAGNGGWPAPPAEPASYNQAPEATWAPAAASAPDDSTPMQPVSEEASRIEIEDDFVVIEDANPETGHGALPHDEHLRQQARALLQELQETIEGLTGVPAGANEALARELEISLTQPAALEGDALADLRAAAEAAQSRPRDLDTITALTAQADTILALIVGYERTTAGIERAIQGLRGNRQDPETPDDVENSA
jgi:hypothetical protein